MFEKMVDELRVKCLEVRYESLDRELTRKMESRSDYDLLFSFNMCLSGFGGSMDASKYLRGKVGENA
jgi:hypothetical protein